MDDDPRPPPLPAMRPAEFAAVRSDVTLLDVREGFELELANLDGAVHVPLRELPGRLGDVPRDARIVVMCHHGVRSAWATRLLRDHGYDAWNLSGGIARYARDVDPDVGTY